MRPNFFSLLFKGNLRYGLVVLPFLFLSLWLSIQMATGPAMAASIWSDVNQETILTQGERRIIPNQYRTLALNVDALQALLATAPMEFSEKAKTDASEIDLPLPNGTLARFWFVESPVMATELGAKYPEIKSYLGRGVDDPTLFTRFGWTYKGFHAIIFSSGPTVYIDPYSTNDVNHYISYYRTDYARSSDAVVKEDEVIIDPAIAAEIETLIASNPEWVIGEQLRTYRLALASTGEYSQYHGGTVPLVLSEMNVAVNRVNGVYERDTAVRMVLVANNDQIIFLNPATDPYTNNNGGLMLGQNQTTLTNIIGTANYDIGHVFSTGGGGVAFLGVVCNASNKARGVTGSSNPINDPFYIDYVAHEMGHQFGANHTFNGNAGSCGGGNRNASTAYEPGSGSTIMAYAGICGLQDLQPNSDDHFHTHSIQEIVAYTTVGSGNTCAAITNTGNSAPTANAGPGGWTIPINTPFILTGSATDPNAGDVLSYNWEQYNLGPAGHPNTPSGDAPIFRSFPSVPAPFRIFPRISDIVNNTQTIGEILPSYARTLTFRLTVRDNHLGAGGVHYASTNVVVTGTAGPFLVTNPNTAITWSVGSSVPITWNVANTNNAPVSCTGVDIALSTDGGFTYPILLAANTTNDGSDTVIVPDQLTTQARVRVMCANNIFFDISNVNFTIVSGGPTPTPTQTPTPTNTSTPTNTPTPTHTPDPSGTLMHVADITMSILVGSGNRNQGQAQVMIVDQNGQPVSGATVSGVFSGASSDTVNGITNGSGQVTLLSTAVRNGTSWSFCVDGVSKSGAVYDPIANVETCDSTGGPTPTPTATPSGAPMHIGDLDGSSVMSGNNWNGTVTITVHDAAHDPIAGVTVTGSWSNGATGTGSCVTNASGQCAITKTGVRGNVTSITFTITNATHGSFTYQPSANHDPDGDSNGTVIVIAKP